MANEHKKYKICTDNQTKVFNGIKFDCLSYLGANLSKFHDCYVLLTHVPPLKTATAQTIDTGMRKDYGDEELYYALKE